MNRLELFINRPELTDWDALIKRALIRHQFENIHPFYDEKGRTGRLLNILYLSRFINQTKGESYHLLQRVRNTPEWEPWLLYRIGGIETTSRQTTGMTHSIRNLLQLYK